ncbi:alpha-2-macroglobulin family protein [Mucilaginibacter endophyticus]|uniref:alpha-2-macroglobulin family protein n=1 Tax=Mucilaginibacter endophyticus TaxID=2675003 RepID=UPI000E0D81F0|nr:alpha-2-macroglobulin family protein [Mucilaginibacter endophyticus]
MQATLKRSLLFFSFLSFCIITTFAQKRLTPSRQNSFYTYIYKVTADDVLKFYQHPDKKPDEQILRNPIDSFKTNTKWDNSLPPGNYMQVAAKKNLLNYSLIENHSANLKLLDNRYDLRFILLDNEGKIINNASVQTNNRTIAYDAKAGLYIADASKKGTILKVDYAGVTNYYDIKKQEKPSYYRYNPYRGMSFFKATWNRFKNLFKKSDKPHYRPQPGHDYEGFMVFNKAIYKPRDTVKFKAFILNKKSKKPVNAAQLLIRLRYRSDEDGKIIGKVKSYRDGAYEYSFALTDSLDLSLDRDYTISLEDPSSEKYKLDDYKGDDDEGFLAKRIVYTTGEFKYEEYELKSITFSTRVDKEEHGPGNPATLYLKAVDENNLPVTDGRVNITLYTRNTGTHRQNYTFVPDQLWTHQLQLDAIGETKLIIPDSIFPKADVTYYINSEFLNSNNERQSADNNMSYRYSRFSVTAKLSGDTLVSEAFDNGKPIKTMATISTLNPRYDTLSKIRVMLPSKTIINPYADNYNIQTDSAYADLYLKNNDSGISLSGYRTADSLFVKVENPRHLHFWYSVFGGNRLIDAGQADNLFYTRAYNNQNIVNFQVHYIWVGESRTEATDIVYRDKLITINVRQPVSVYPGQQAKTDIVVTDAKGQPVANADLTAWSMTSKFTDYRTPYVPYLGKDFIYRKQKAAFEANGVNIIGTLQLNWKRWSKEMGLDSIAYYQFTHPDKIYRVEEDTKDSLTQVAPFVVKNGDVLPVHILYIDNRPVYFDQTRQLKRYSFAVSPGKHLFRFRTSHQNVWVDTIDVPKSKKLIFSINADSAKFTKVSDTLSTYECDLINRYLITIINNFGWKMALLTQSEKVFMINADPGQYNSVLVGPLAENFANLEVKGGESRYFATEPGYSFQFDPGLIKQKSIATAYPFNPVLSSYQGTADDYTQEVLTRPEAENVWQQYLDLRSNTQALFNNPTISGEIGKLSMNITQPENKKLLIKNIIIYKYNDPDFVMIYPGNTTYVSGLNAGRYWVLFLLKGDNYDIKENVVIKTQGTNFYNFTVLPAHAKDSVGSRISNIINNRTGTYTNGDREIENDALKIKEAFNDKYLDSGSFGDTMSGIISGYDNQPAAGVSIRVRGAATGTFTDANGRFKVKVPKNGRLIISYIGYETQQVPIHPGETLRLALTSSSKLLQEVVVVGYGTVMRRELTGSVSTVTYGLAGQVPGVSVNDGSPNLKVMIRGVSSLPSAPPLVVVDGEIVASLSDINKDDIAEISILKEAAATAIYGARAANGVIVIKTKAKPGLAGGQKADTTQTGGTSTLRKNFSDYAYWQPKLTTDEHGKASFMVTYPDDITNWRTFIIGINGNKQTGFAESNIKSYKPLSANFIAPQFAVAGDEMNLIGKVMNYNTNTAKLTRVFKYNGQTLKQDELEIKNSKIDTLGITATSTDSLTFEYTIKRDNGYFDGEQRKIPVMPQGVKETKGIFEALDRDTTVCLKFDPALGPITFRAEASALPVLAEETRKLREYKYLCNEQLASKLKGLLMERRIKKFMGEDFRYEKNIREVIKKMQENRRGNGTWGWWKDSNEELWISLHAIEALVNAQKEGFVVELDKQKLTDYLVYQLESYKDRDKIFCLQLLHKLEAKVDYQKYVAIIEKKQAKAREPFGGGLLVYDKLRLMLLRQESGLPIKMDSLLKPSKRTMFGNMYWGEDDYRFFDNSIQLSILAYHIIKNDGSHPELLSKIRGYFLEQRRHGDWRNTYESALILETILPDLLIENKQVKPSQITLNGSDTKTISKFPYSATLTDKQISVNKTGSLPVYITGYQQFWNSKPEKVSKDFTVDTWFEHKEKAITTLKGGEAVLLKAEVTVRGDADFVMVEIPIPAGCSYESKEQSWQNNEVHREYFKEKVSIFCRSLKQGKYTFTVNLIPRYNGKYTLNPAKAEMMYFPVFYGREGMKQVVID